MAEFEEKLNQILSSPKAMEQIMSLASSIGAETEGAAEPVPDTGAEALPAIAAPSGGLGDLLGSVDPATVSKLMTLFSVYQDRSDEKTRLLEAMKPFLREERQAKLDQAVRITRLSRVIRSAMTLFAGGGHV